MAGKPARFQILDKEGNVIRAGSVKAKVKTIDGVPIIPEFEKPLVSVTITNPFKKILYWLDQIRKRQTTTLAFKLSIPLIALPVVMVGVFSLGRLSGISFQKTQQSQNTVSPSPVAQRNTTISKAGTLKIAVGATKTNYLLALRNGSIVNLEIPADIVLTKYQNKQVLVTGSYNQNSGILYVTDIAEIQVFNTLEIPQSTESAKQN